MTDRAFTVTAGLFLILSSATAAQSRPGLAFDQVVQIATEHDTSHTAIHITVAGSDMRMEMQKGSTVSQFSKLPIGDAGVMIFRKGGEEMILLDPANKEYMSIKLKEMMQASQKMIESMGGSMRIDTSASGIQVDSLGPGSLIDGHPTLRYRLTTRVRMIVSMPDSHQTIDTQATSDIDAASDLSDFSNIVSPMNAFGDMMQSFGMGKDFLEKAQSAQHKIHGFPIHSVNRQTQSTNGVVHTRTETSDTRNIRRVTAPDSAFTAPANYKAISMLGIPPSHQ